MELVHAGSIPYSCHGVFSRWSGEVLWRTSLDLSSGEIEHLYKNKYTNWFENVNFSSFRLVEVKTFHMMVSVACYCDCVLCVEHAYEGKVVTRLGKLSKFVDIQDSIVIWMCAHTVHTALFWCCVCLIV